MMLGLEGLWIPYPPPSGSKKQKILTLKTRFLNFFESLTVIWGGETGSNNLRL